MKRAYRRVLSLFTGPNSGTERVEAVRTRALGERADSVGCVHAGSASNMDGAIHVVLASDANYRPGLEVTRASIIRSCSAPERLVWHVFDEHALEKLDVSLFATYNTSKMPWLRLFLPGLLPGIDHVLYSDVDTVWMRDACALWDETVGNGMPDFSIWWVRDLGITVDGVRTWMRQVEPNFDDSRYGCTGVCIMNLKKMREQNLSARSMDIVRRFGCPRFADQDVLNVLYNHDCGLLSDCWDVIGQWYNERGWDRFVGADGKAVYHIIGVGRHFHDRTPADYPSAYDFWNRVAGRRPWNAPMRRRYRLLAACWWASGLVRFLPGEVLRCRVYRQWLFAKVIREMSE